MVLIFLPLEGATRFRLRGGVIGWTAVAISYSIREVVMASVLGEGSPVSSIVFRMGIILLVTLIAGGMVNEEHRQRERAEIAAANLRRLDALRRNLVATLAHDVRAPLTAIRGSLELLGKSAVSLSVEQQREIVDLADRQARRLSALMFDLLDQARLEAGHLELHRERVDIGGIATEVLSYMDSENRFRVDVPSGTEVAADARRVEQILANLISNALRYGAAPFLLWARPSPLGGVDIAVEDHGPGIDPERLQRLYQPFESDAPDEVQGSVGLGLWIARSLAELHGGDLRNNPLDSAGARFVLHLPDAQPDEVVAI
jgi:signal transduction histidine kinase